MFRLSMAFACLVVLSACAAASYRDTVVARDFAGISGSRVFVYSFLSLANEVAGSDVLAVVDGQLSEGLAQHSVAVEFGNPSTSAKSELLGTRRLFRTTEQDLRPLIDEAIATRAAEERAFRANYRLIITPRDIRVDQSYYTGSAVGGEYVVAWSLVDIATNEVVWRTEMEGGYRGGGGSAADRAAGIVDGALEQMRLSGVLPAGN